MSSTASRLQLVQNREIELKLALPAADPTTLLQRLRRLPLLARRKPLHQHLHSIYYDTPDRRLRGGQVALRLRRIDDGDVSGWVQTLKTAGAQDSALTQRGEWEVPLAEAKLSQRHLLDTPWATIDPDGSLFKALAPCFATSFQRSSWQVRRRNGSHVEIALDIGSISTEDKAMPLCELELELKAGPDAALFELASQLAAMLPVLPLNLSKAQRGQALADGLEHAPRRARPEVAVQGQPLPAIARAVLQECFGQFTTNLQILGSSDDPELVHQARVGWRRFRSARRLFGPALEGVLEPDWTSLRPLLEPLGALRDLDVARRETLPALAEAYAMGDAGRQASWQSMMLALDRLAAGRLAEVRAAIGQPAIGAVLLATTRWLDGLGRPAEPAIKPPLPGRELREWTRRRLGRLRDRMLEAADDHDDPERQHEARILAKRLRYGIEELRQLLPKRLAQRWHEQAVAKQSDIGANRDLAQAVALVATLDVDSGLQEFLRGAGIAGALVSRPAP